MTNREFYLQRRKAEFPVFVRVLQALPEGQLSYRPHDRCSSAEQIVATLVGELKSCVDAAATFRGEYAVAPPTEHAKSIAQFEASANELYDRVARMSESDWERKAQFFYKGQMVSEQPLCDFLWMIHFDAIHHRGQLTSYLRPMGGKVPAIYGPSADERSM
jgi:cation diffusion facilitator CzcD-associated flavoprotein CzcO